MKTPLSFIQEVSQLCAVQVTCPNMVRELSTYLQTTFEAKRVLIYLEDPFEEQRLLLEFINPRFDAPTPTAYSFSAFRITEDVLLRQMLGGNVLTVSPADLAESRLSFLSTYFHEGASLTMRLLIVQQRVIGLILLEDTDVPQDTTREYLSYAAEAAANFLHLATHQTRKQERLELQVNQLHILQQIDEELNDTIKLETVFSRIMDWALRFTNAHAAALALYSEFTDDLTISAHYGYQKDREAIERMARQQGGGITKIVATSGLPMIVPDVLANANYIPINGMSRSQMSVPIYRENQVIAVITLESKNVNAFTDDHLSFVERLAQRAGVAVDNARLFTETNQERKKLSTILRNIADIVIVLGADAQIVLINEAAVHALRLNPDADLTGASLPEVANNQDLTDFLQQALTNSSFTSDEVLLPNGRTYLAKYEPYPGIGAILVMQDVTTYKETDQLKSELVSTVSHDLKQPLAVMSGYLDLMRLSPEQNERITRYVNGIGTAIDNMRQLIDDLLDLARIESGIQLEPDSVNVHALLLNCISTARPQADSKSIRLSYTLPDHELYITGDESRLHQVFNNLLGNAVKYTPKDGRVSITAETNYDSVIIHVKDTGIGIDEADLDHIFERFYRIRRKETENIDGTGLGLAIVHSLVEAHGGKITVNSKPDEGSTFTVYLPLHSATQPV